MVAQRPLEVRYEVSGKLLPLSLRSQGNNAPLVQSMSLRVEFRLPRHSGVGFLPPRRLLVPFQKLPLLAMRQCGNAAMPRLGSSHLRTCWDVFRLTGQTGETLSSQSCRRTLSRIKSASSHCSPLFLCDRIVRLYRGSQWRLCCIGSFNTGVSPQGWLHFHPTRGAGTSS